MEKQTFNYDGLFNLSSLSFNTVQGLNLDSGFSFTDWSANEKGKYTSIKTTFNYSFQKALTNHRNVYTSIQQTELCKYWRREAQ
jgi:hypothetical protein